MPESGQLIGERRLLAFTSNRSWQGDVSPFLFIVPALAVYSAFFIYPLVKLLELSLFRWDGILARKFIGLRHYEKLLSDDRFWGAISHNFTWMIAAIIVPVLFGLLLAILLSRSSMYGSIIFRTIFFMPQVFSSVTVALIWQWIYNPSYGAINVFLGAIGLEQLTQGWLGDSDLVLPSLFIAWSWVHYGFTMIIFIAAIDAVDEVFFDAAKVDGANWWQQFRHILLPSIRGALTTIILVTAISSFQVFDLVYVLTRGGPGDASMVVPVYMLESAFTLRKVGYGATVAIAMGLVIVGFSVLFLALRGVYKEAD